MFGDSYDEKGTSTGSSSSVSSNISNSSSSSISSRYAALISSGKANAAELLGQDDMTDEDVDSPDLAPRLGVMAKYASDSPDFKQACSDLFSLAKGVKVLPFVNREEQVAKFVACLVLTQVTYLQGHGDTVHRGRATPFLDQMFGSGKTTLASRALEFADKGLQWSSPGSVPHPKDGYGRAICRELFSSLHEKDASIRKARCRVLHDVLKSAVCIVHFDSINPYTNHDSKESDIDNTIARLIARRLDVKTDIVGQSKLFSDGIEAVARKLDRKSILLIVDETNAHGSKDAISDIRRMWTYFTRHADTLSKGSSPILFHVAFCGRQTLFLTIGKGEGSPAAVEWILLPSLKLEHIKGIVKEMQHKEHIPQFPLLSFRRDDIEDHFFERLLETTGGVPRMLEYVLNALLHLFRELQLADGGNPTGTQPVHIVAKEEVDFILDHVIFTGFCNTAPDKAKFCISGLLGSTAEDEKFLLQSTLGMLLLSAETEQEVSIDAAVRLGNSEYKLGELINRLPIFLDVAKAGFEKVKIQRSQYLLRIVLESASKISTDASSSLQSLLTLISARCGPAHHGDTTQDAAGLFELMFASRMAQHFEASRKFRGALRFPGIDSILAHTDSNDFIVPQDAHLDIGVWPKVAGGDENAEDENEKGKKKSNAGKGFRPSLAEVKECTPEELGNEIRRLIMDRRNRNKVCVFLMRGESKSADIYVIQIAQPITVIGIQAKSGNSERIGPTKIKREWAKFWATCPRGLGTPVRFVLIVAAMQYSKELSDVLNYSGGVLHLGGSRRRFLGRESSDRRIVGIASTGTPEQCYLETKEHKHPLTRLSRAPRKMDRSKSVIVLPIGEDGSPFQSEAAGFSESGQRWTEILPGAFSEEDGTKSSQCHILLWSRTAIERFLGPAEVEAFDKVKFAADNEQNKVSFVYSLIRPHPSIFGLSHTGTRKQIAPADDHIHRITAVARSEMESSMSSSLGKLSIHEEHTGSSSSSVISLDPFTNPSEKVYLDIGDTIFSTSLGTLTNGKSTYFTNLMNSGEYQTIRNAEGQIYIDRDPEHFKLILGFLRGSEDSVLMRIQEQLSKFDLFDLLDEAKFYGIQPLVDVINERVSSME